MSARKLPSVGSTARRRPVAAVDPQLLEILGPAPILESENLDSYNALYDRVRSAVAPEDIIEEIWVRDIVDLSCDVLRLRRLRSAIFAANAHHGTKAILARLFDYPKLQDLVGGWAAGDKASLKLVDQVMEAGGFDQETLEAATLAASIDTFERIDHLTLQAEARRNAALSAIDRRREGFARRLREAAAEIDGAAYKDVTAPATADQEAA